VIKLGKWKLGGEREQAGKGGSQGNKSRIQMAGASKNSKSSIGSASMVKKTGVMFDGMVRSNCQC
jgi:hypothetical protein